MLSICCLLNSCEGSEPHPWLQWGCQGMRQRKDVIVSLPTNVSLTAPLDHSTRTSSHGSHGHSTDEEVITDFLPSATTQKYMISC